MSSRQPHTLRISKPESGFGHRAELDGHDVSNALLGLTLRISGGEMPKATLELVAEEISTELDDVRAYLPDATKDLLVRLGWTPPAEEATP